MKDKRISKQRFIQSKFDDKYFLVDYAYRDELVSYDLYYEVGEFYKIKSSLLGLEIGLLTVTPVLMGLFTPITDIILYNNDTLYLLNGKLHRNDEPIIINLNNYWFLNGIKYTEEEFWEIQKDTVHAPKISAYILGKKI